ncbi:hypothetical protein MPL3356_80073 [Mesorhizobium plurifarium]|uniref:Uncharacterized protein n=1 Tax=Mesorhizobium plurifarium TaxID=69974 RepID=A0A090EIP5_MESPL|nr:hypothetical protein MPL3356_80073 [Mesorhizobium plurifarium]
MRLHARLSVGAGYPSAHRNTRQLLTGDCAGFSMMPDAWIRGTNSYVQEKLSYAYKFPLEFSFR